MCLTFVGGDVTIVSTNFFESENKNEKAFLSVNPCRCFATLKGKAFKKSFQISDFNYRTVEVILCF